MSFRMDCPRCKRGLNVTEIAFGKTLPCPGCGQPFKVPHPGLQPVHVDLPGAPPALSVAGARVDGTSASQEPHAREMPPLPGGDRTSDSGGHRSYSSYSESPGNGNGLNLVDMLFGREKESVFHLAPDEKVLKEVLIHHRLFFYVDRGITRVTLTTQRLLYTSTRVFSPVYWLLLLFFPLAIFYYVFRLSRNRNGSIPLCSVDSVEKRYFPNGPLFGTALIAGSLAIWLCGEILEQVHTSQDARFVVLYLLTGVAALVILALLLATRVPWMFIRSGNNWFPISRSPGDEGGDEEELDSFFQETQREVQRAKMLKSL
jgi:hypothetical protein